MTQTARQQAIAIHLASSPATVRELADKFGECTKTIRRDLAALRSQGLHLVETTERHGRKRWTIRPSGCRTKRVVLWLTEDEHAAIKRQGKIQDVLRCLLRQAGLI